MLLVSESGVSVCGSQKNINTPPKTDKRTDGSVMMNLVGLTCLEIWADKEG